MTYVLRPTFFILVCAVFFALPAYAHDDAAYAQEVDITAGVKKAAEATDVGELKETTLGETVGKIVRGILGLLGIVFLIYTVYGGYVYLTAGGEEDKVKDAKNIIKHGVIGLIIMVAAFAIAEFVLDKVFQAVGVE